MCHLGSRQGQLEQQELQQLHHQQVLGFQQEEVLQELQGFHQDSMRGQLEQELQQNHRLVE